MRRPAVRIVEPIPYPDCLKPYLTHLDRREAEITNQNVAEILESGFLPGNGPPPELRRWKTVFALIESLNDVIEALNLITADMWALPLVARRLGGSPSKRIDLLVRVFFAEFFRGREVTRKVLAELRRGGVIDRETVKSIVGSLDEHLGDTVRMRNALVHGEAGLAGLPYNGLAVFERSPRSVRFFGGLRGLTLRRKISVASRDRARAMETYCQTFRAAYGGVVEIVCEVDRPVA